MITSALRLGIRLSLALAVTAALITPAITTLSAARQEPSLIGKPAPAFALKDMAGKPLSLAAYKGKVVLLDFWATWCVPCREEIPHFLALQKKYGARGFAVIGVSMDDDAKPIPAFVKKYGVTYPVALGDAALGDKYGGVLGLPVAFVIDRAGVIRQRFDGITTLDEFDKAIAPLFGK